MPLEHFALSFRQGSRPVRPEPLWASSGKDPERYAAGWITGIFPLSDGHSVRLAGITSTRFSEMILLSGKWEGFVVLSLKENVLPARGSISGNPGPL